MKSTMPASSHERGRAGPRWFSLSSGPSVSVHNIDNGWRGVVPPEEMYQRVRARRRPSFMLARVERQNVADYRVRPAAVEVLARLGAVRSVLRARTGAILWT
jgi:hypothetical protein